MNAKGLASAFLFLAPPAIWILGGSYSLECAWRRDPSSEIIQAGVAFLIFLLMSVGIYLSAPTRASFAYRAIALAVVFYLAPQLSRISVSNNIPRIEIDCTRYAFTERSGAFAHYWTDLYITERKFIIFRKTRHLRQYSSGVIPKMRVDSDGALIVDLHTGAEREAKDVKVDRFPQSTWGL